MTYDERALGQLLEASQDLQSDAMRATEEPLAALVELGQERRARGTPDPEEVRAFDQARRRALRERLTTGALAVAGFGAALVRLWDTPAFAQASGDVQILQTAASLENLAVAAYGTALTLPFISGPSANAVIKTFIIGPLKNASASVNAGRACCQSERVVTGASSSRSRVQASRATSRRATLSAQKTAAPPGETEKSPELRLTLLVNYWDRRPAPPNCRDYDGTIYPSIQDQGVGSATGSRRRPPLARRK